MKKIRKLLPILGLSFLLVGCNKVENTSSTLLTTPNDLTINVADSTYSFTGVDNATYYSIKVYKKEADNTYGTRAVASSGMIKKNTDGSNSYSGTFEDYQFLAGDYRATIKSIAPKYKTGTGTKDFTSTMLGAPTVTAYFNESGEGDAKVVSIDVSITAAETITTSYTLDILNASNTSIYTNASALAGDINIKASDLTGVESISSDDTYTVKVQGNAIEGYTQASAVTAKVSKKSNNNNPGGPGDNNPGGPGDNNPSAGFSLTVSDVDIDVTADSGSFKLGGSISCTATKGSAPAGADYYWEFNDGNAVTGTITCNSDKTVKITANGGPYNNSEASGTWSVADNKLAITLS